MTASIVAVPVRILRILVRLGLALNDPKITAPLLFVLLYCPDKLRARLPSNLSPILQSSALVSTLKVLLGLEAAKRVNRWLSQKGANNWMKDAKFVPEQELVLITGGSSGIGESMSKMFANEGCKVVVLDLKESSQKLPANIFFYQCDVTDSGKLAAVASQIRKEHGEPSVLINNAGKGTSRTILNGSEGGIRKTFEVNILAHYWTVREFLPDMIKKDHGHIVAIASAASYIAQSQNVDYCCTKAGVVAFHEGLASELKSRYNAPNVRTTIVNPSWVRTPLIAPLLAQPGFKGQVLEIEEVSEVVVKQVLSGRGAQIVLPENLNYITTIRGWPIWMQVRARNAIAQTSSFYMGPSNSFLKE